MNERSQGSSDSEHVSLDVSLSHLQLVLDFMPRADAKVAFVIAAAIGQLGVLALNLPSYSLLDAWSLVAIPSVIFLMLATWRSYRATRPMLSGGTASLVYFQSISNMTESSFLASYCSLSIDEAKRHVAEQIWRNSKIAAAKYRFVSDAYRDLLIGSLLWILALAVIVLRYGDGNKLLRIGS